MNDDPEREVKSITLNEGDRQLVGMAARLLMAQAPGQNRTDDIDRFADLYRDDLVAAHPGVEAATIEDMTVNFVGALLLEMERWADNDHELEPLRPVGAASRAALARLALWRFRMRSCSAVQSSLQKAL